MSQLAALRHARDRPLDRVELEDRRQNLHATDEREDHQDQDDQDPEKADALLSIHVRSLRVN
jgi:hypothetical protein